MMLAARGNRLNGFHSALGLLVRLAEAQARMTGTTLFTRWSMWLFSTNFAAGCSSLLALGSSPFALSHFTFAQSA
jgi:hypothetical protein